MPSIPRRVLDHLHRYKNGARSAEFLRSIITDSVVADKKKQLSFLDKLNRNMCETRKLARKEYLSRVRSATKDIPADSAQGKWLKAYAAPNRDARRLYKDYEQLTTGTVAGDPIFTARIQALGPIYPAYFDGFKMSPKEKPARTEARQSKVKANTEGDHAGLIVVTHETADQLVQQATEYIRAFPGIVDHHANNPKELREAIYTAIAWLKLLFGRRLSEVAVRATIDLCPDYDHCVIVSNLAKEGNEEADEDYAEYTIPCLCDPSLVIAAADIVQTYIKRHGFNDKHSRDGDTVVGDWFHHTTSRGFYARQCYRKRFELGFMPDAVHENAFMSRVLCHKHSSSNDNYLGALALAENREMAQSIFPKARVL